MFRLLYKYLILNKKVTVPGIGIFYIERQPARLDFANKVFVPPAFAIGFKPAQSVNDTQVYTFISREQNIDDSEAVSRYYKFADDLKESLDKHRSAELPGIGMLLQNEEGRLYFKATTRLDNYFPPIAADRVLRENIEHHVLVGERSHTNTEMREMLVDDVPAASHAKDYWWIFAIALGIIGIATIVYYYLNNGNLR